MLFSPSWLDDNTLQLETQTLGNYDAAIMTSTFDGKSISGHLTTLFDYKVDLKGEAEE